MIQEIEYKIVGKAEGKARLPKISNRRKLLVSLGLKVKRKRVLCQNPSPLGAEQEPRKLVLTSRRCFCHYCFLFWPCHTVGYQFPHQGSNPRPLQGKLRILTMGPPGKPLSITYELKLLFAFVSIICGHPRHCSVYPLPSASDYTGLYWGPGLSLI